MSSTAAPSVPPSPSWLARLTRSPGAAVRRPQRRSASNKRTAAAAGAGAGSAEEPLGSQRRSIRASNDEEAGDEDDEDSSEHAGGGRLSTSSLGRNHRLSFLGLLAPPATQNLVRMSSQPPQRHQTQGSSLLRGAAAPGSAHQQRPVKAKPFLTLSLLKLNDILPAYCRALADPAQGAAQACALLDSSVATATSAWAPSAASPRGAANRPHADGREDPRGYVGVASSSSGTPPTAGSLLHWLGAPASSSIASTTAQQASTNPLRFPSNPFSSSPPSSDSAMALEGEWESYTAPLFLLAAAETLYHDMNHCFHHRFDVGQDKASHARRAALERLYARIVNDLVQVKALLCDPFLAQTLTEATAASAEGAVGEGTSGSESSHPLSSAAPLVVERLSSSVQRSIDAARCLSSMLDVMVTIGRARAQLVALQCQLFASAAASFTQGWSGESEPDVENLREGSRKRMTAAPRTSPSSCLAEATLAVRLLLQSLPSTPPSMSLSDSSFSGLRLLYQSIITESKRWKHSLDAACGLDRCQFYDTLLSLRRLKSSLLEEASHPRSRLNLWFRSTYDRITSLLPVYFDRVQAFSTPLYGYDTSLLLNGKSVDADWNAAVVDVLRKQEKSGPHMAFALVLDAESAGTTNVQKGLQLAALSGQAATELGDSRTAWPALYIRSTLHFSSAGPRPNLTHGSSAYLNSSSQGSILQNWSIGGNPSTSSLSVSNVVPTKVPLSFFKASVLEYAPESGIASWPHSDWDRLSVILRNQRFDESEPTSTDSEGAAPSKFIVRAVTYRDQEEEDERPSRVSRDSMRSLEEASFDGSPRKPATMDPTAKEKPASVFHTCPVSDLVTLVAIVAAEGDDHRWRRKTGLSDQEIQDTIVELALHFSVVRNFTVYNIPSNQQDNLIVKSLRYAFKASQTPSVLTRKTESSASPAFRDCNSRLTDECVRAFLKDVKVTLGLRPVNPLSQDALRSTATLSPTSRRFLAQRASSISSTTSSLFGVRRHENRALDDVPERLDTSALNLFVGSDLASFFS